MEPCGLGWDGGSEGTSLPPTPIPAAGEEGGSEVDGCLG